MLQRTLSGKIRDYALYCLIGLVFVGLILLHAAYVPEKYYFGTKWVLLAAATCLTFAYPIRWFRRCWNSWRFWIALSCLLTIHLIAYIVILGRLRQFPLLAVALITGIEWKCIIAIIERVGKRRQDKRLKWSDTL